MKISEYWNLFDTKVSRYKSKYYHRPFLMLVKVLASLVPSIFKVRKEKDEFSFDHDYFLKDHPQKVLVVHFSDLGDYILKRSFFSLLRKCPKYKNAEFHLLLTGSSLDLAQTVDSDLFTKIIACRGGFHRLRSKGKEICLRELFNEGLDHYYDTILFPDFNNNIHTDAYLVLLNNILSKESVVFQGDRSYLRVWPQSSQFTRVIPSIHLYNTFEFESNKFFFEQVTGIKSSLSVPEISHSAFSTTRYPAGEKYIVINPGAQDDIRKWHKNNMAEVVSRLPAEYRVVFCCIEKDRDTCEDINKRAGRKCEILCNLKFNEIVPLIANAALYIGMDSGFFHLAVALKTKAICISGGVNYARFLSYPQSDSWRILLPYGIEEFYQYLFQERRLEPNLDDPRNAFDKILLSFHTKKKFCQMIYKGLNKILLGQGETILLDRNTNIYGAVNAVSVDQVTAAVDELLPK